MEFRSTIPMPRVVFEPGPHESTWSPLGKIVVSDCAIYVSVLHHLGLSDLTLLVLFHALVLMIWFLVLFGHIVRFV